MQPFDFPLKADPPKFCGGDSNPQRASEGEQGGNMAITAKTKDAIWLGSDAAGSKAPGLSSKEYLDKVTNKAYELYQKKGSKPGHDKEDWYEAERLVKAGKA